MTKQFARYESYKDSGVAWLGEIPAHWEFTRLGTKFIERRTKVSDKDYPALSVTKGGIVPQLENAAKTNDGDNRKLVKTGDFVINSRSDRKGSSGISIYEGSVSLINIVLQPLFIDSKYCHYLLKSYSFIEEFYRNGHGIVADLWTTRFDEMRTILLSLPNSEEQQRIANFLDKKTTQIDEAIAQKEKMIELLKEYRQIIINNAVTKGLGPNVPMKDSGIEWLGQIPAHWEVKKLKFTLIEKLKYGANESGVEYSEKLPRYIRITDFSNNGKLSDVNKLSLPARIANDYLLKDGDILFARSGATVGKSYQFKKNISNEDSYCFAGYLIKASANEQLILSDFLYLYTNSPLFYLWKDFMFNKATIENIGADKYAQLPVIIPPIEEQTKILEVFKELNDKIEASIICKQQEIEKLKEYKATLIDSAVTGKIKV
ncbi:MAG: restriction endonuclease subunit S [Burkholderiales bacterium]|nr:restriction endonuclease subunit S [Burkholderiales bacterium]